MAKQPTAPSTGTTPAPIVNADLPDVLGLNPVRVAADETVSNADGVDDDASDRMAEGMPTVVQQCTAYGDYSLFEECSDLIRKDLRNAARMTIYPGEVVNKNDPSKPYKYYWHLLLKNNLNSSMDLMTLKDRGFFTVNKNDGFVSSVFQTGEDGVFTIGGMLILMAQDETTYQTEKANRNTPAQFILKASRDALHEYAERHSAMGIGTVEGEGYDEIENGDLRTVVRAGNR